MKNKSAVIQTYSGIEVDVFNLDIDLIKIEDIAHSLSHLARYLGHSPEFLSVAQHSVMVMEAVDDPSLKLAALLHDAQESLICDMPTPIKDMMPEYRELEDKLMAQMAKKFGFEYPLHPNIIWADKAIFHQEYEELIMGGAHFECWTPKDAKRRFLEAYYSLV